MPFSVYKLRRRAAITIDNLDEKFEAFLARDDDALVGSQFFEALAEIERRRAQDDD